MNLMEKYNQEAKKKLLAEFSLKNNMAVPKIVRIVVNTGIGDIKDSKDEQGKVINEIASIANQKPTLRLARQSVAGFGIRKGQPVGVSVTLRGQSMYSFLEKLVKIVLPRLRDFRGVRKSSFDDHGNYTLGLAEHSVFPEIDLGKVSKARGLEITIVTNTVNKQQSLRLLEELGMPFEKEEDNK